MKQRLIFPSGFILSVHKACMRLLDFHLHWRLKEIQYSVTMFDTEKKAFKTHSLKILLLLRTPRKEPEYSFIRLTTIGTGLIRRTFWMVASPSSSWPSTEMGKPCTYNIRLDLWNMLYIKTETLIIGWFPWLNLCRQDTPLSTVIHTEHISVMMSD